MKLNHFMLAFVCVITMAACSKSDLEYKTSFKKSQKAWSAFKASSNNSYRFQMVGGSWVGTSWSTSIKVTSGVAVERVFVYTRFMNIAKPEAGWNDEKRQEILAAMQLTAAEFKERTGKELTDYLEWREYGATIGTHRDSPTDPYLTLDDIYDKAQNEWLKKNDDVTNYFEAKNNGMISSCGYVPIGCMDDCFNGVNISLIEPL